MCEALHTPETLEKWELCECVKENVFFLSVRKTF
nr:MAG TPA: hypothetical protein [Caudoviricetes sp.]